MERETEVTDGDFGFEWGRSEGQYFLRNPDGDVKRVTRTVVEQLRESARDETGGLTDLVDEADERSDAAAAALRELVDEDFIRADAPVERIRSPDDVRLWPRTALFLVLLAVGVVAAYVELRSLPAVPSLLGSLSLAQFATATALTFALVVVHEYGHYRASKPYFDARFGAGTVNAVVPVAKTITTDAWLLPRNIRRWINLAGPFVELVVLVPVVAVHHALFPDSLILSLLVVFAMSHVAFSLNPLYHGDGYWLLADTIDVFNLRSRGLEDLSNLRPTWFAAYALASYGFAVVAMSYSTYFTYVHFGPIGVVPVATFLAGAYLASWFDLRERATAAFSALATGLR